MLPRPGNNEATDAVFESSAICYYPSNHPPWPELRLPPRRHYLLSGLLPSTAPTLWPRPSVLRGPIGMNSKHLSLIAFPLLIEGARSVRCAVPSSWKRPGPSFPTVVLAASWGVVMREGKRCSLWGIDGGHALKRLVLRPIASHTLWRRRERPRSSPGPRPRPSRPTAITCPPEQTLALFSAFSTRLLAGERGSSRGPRFTGSRYPECATDAWASCFLVLFSLVSPPLSWCWAWFHGQPVLEPVLGLDAPLQIIIWSPFDIGQLNSCSFRAFGFRGPRPNSLSSSSTSTSFDSAASTARFQLVLVFSHFFFLLEACHHRSHPQAWRACRLSGLLPPGLSCLLSYRALRAPSSQSPLFVYLDYKILVSLAQVDFRPSGSMVGQVFLLSQSIW